MMLPEKVDVIMRLVAAFFGGFGIGAVIKSVARKK